MKNSIVFLAFIFSFSNGFSQCTGGVSAGSLTPTTAYQTTSVLNGQYFTVNVNMCDVYDFTFCSADFAAATNNGWDTQITILDATGATSLGFNDDNCSLGSKITWTAAFTGTIRVLVTEFSCNIDQTSSATLAYKKTISTGGDYCLFQSANNQVVGGENCVELTAALNDQTGCAWNKTPIDFSQPFMLTLDYYFGNSINGADGTTFTFLPSISGCGTAGGQLGAGGLASALTVEFDTYDNDNPAHVFDIAADHIAVNINGNLQGPGAPLCGPVPAIATSANIDDGTTHNVQIAWDPTTNSLNIYFDGDLRLSCNYDFINNLFGGQTQIYWGATAATGGFNNQQYFCPNTVVLPVKITEFKTSCENESNKIVWISGTEHRLDYYFLEYTLDGYVFYPLGKVQANGDSETPIEYNFTDQTSRNQQAYYRLTSVDKDGKKESTNLISALNCITESNKMITSIFLTDENVSIQFTENQVYFQLFDLSGKSITPILSNGEKAEQKIINTFAAGIYILKAYNSKGNKVEQYKISIL